MKHSVSFITAILLASLIYLSGCRGTASQMDIDKNPPTVVTSLVFPKANYAIATKTTVNNSVSIWGDSAYIKLTIQKYGAHTGQIFITQQLDNGKTKRYSPPYSLQGTFDGVKYYTFEKGDTINQTYSIPSDIDTAFTLLIPVKLRNTGAPLADTYTIWITKRDTEGDFTNPSLGLAYGVADVTFSYLPDGLMSYYTTSLGNSIDTTLASCFSSPTGTKYSLATVKDTLNKNTIPPIVDFIYNNTATDAYVFGSVKKSGTNFDFNDEVIAGLRYDSVRLNRISNVTLFEKVPEGISFESITTSKELTDLVDGLIPINSSSPKQSFVKYSNNPIGSMYVFKTAAGYRGLALIKEISGNGLKTGTTTLQLKVQR